MQHLIADPDLVQMQAAAITAAATEIHDASRQLATLGGNEFQSKAVDAFRTNVRQLITVLDDAQIRYADTGRALTTYAPVLRQVQEEIDQAIAIVSHADVNGALHQSETAQLHAVTNNLNPFVSESDKDEANLIAAQAKAHLEQQKAAVAMAEAKYESAMNDLQAAANIAASQIENGIEMSHLNDTFDDRVNSVLDKVHNLLSKALLFVHEMLSQLSELVSDVAFVCLLLALLPIPYVQEILAGVGGALLVVSAVLNIADLAVQLGRYLIGDVQLGELIGTALIAGASILLADFGGRVAVNALVKYGLKAVEKLPIETVVQVVDSGPGQALSLVIDKLNKQKDPNQEGTDPLSSFLDNHFLPDSSITQFVKDGTSQDVGQLTPDFSHVGVYEILRGSGMSRSDSMPVHASVLLA